MRILMTKEGKKFYVKDTSKDYHCQYGVIKAADLKKKNVTTNTGKKLHSFPASFIDVYQKIKRSAQIIPLKDIGTIMTKTGINKNSVVVDAGAGSGGTSCLFAMHAKKVHTFDIRDDHIEIVKHNKELLGLKNLTVNNHNIYEDIPVKKVDVVSLDVPEPWEAIGSAKKALKSGGFIVSYSPSVPQVMDFVNAVKKTKGIIHLETIEITERQWEIDERKVRPKTRGLGHSGFLSFVRKL